MRPKPLILAAGLILVSVSRAPAEQLFESKGVVQVNAPVLQLGPLAPARPADLSNELYIILSDRILRETIDKLDLADRWKVKPDAAVKRLRDMLDRKVIRGTNLIEVRVQSPQAEEAQQICTTLLNVYKAYREAQERERAKHALKALEAELQLQENVVEEKRKAFHAILKAVGRPFEEGKDPRATLQDAHEAATELAADRARIEAALDALLALEDKERMGRIIEELKTERARLAAEQNDPQAIEQRRLEDPVDQALEAQDYAEAKAAHESALRILESMKINFASRRATLDILKTPVTIHEQPKAGRAPERENK